MYFSYNFDFQLPSNVSWGPRLNSFEVFTVAPPYRDVQILRSSFALMRYLVDEIWNRNGVQFTRVSDLATVSMLEAHMTGKVFPFAHLTIDSYQEGQFIERLNLTFQDATITAFYPRKGRYPVGDVWMDYDKVQVNAVAVGGGPSSP